MKFTDKLQYLRYLVDKRGMKPVYLILGLTYDCNSFCRTCFNWEQLRKNKEHELSLEELQKTFATMGEMLFIVMSGGEPFLRRDLPDICEMLSTKNGVKQITIPTGAIASDLIARTVEATLERCPGTQIVVNLSIDHIGEKHDWIRGVPGNYEKAKKTYAKLMPLKERFDNLTVNVHTCLCTFNAEDLDEMFVGIRRDFPEISFHSFEMLRGDQPDKNIQPITTQRYRVPPLRQLPQVREDLLAPDGAGRAGAGDAGPPLPRRLHLRRARRPRRGPDVRAARAGRQREGHELRLRRPLDERRVGPPARLDQSQGVPLHALLLHVLVAGLRRAHVRRVADVDGGEFPQRGVVLSAA